MSERLTPEQQLEAQIAILQSQRDDLADCLMAMLRQHSSLTMPVCQCEACRNARHRLERMGYPR